MPTASIIDSLDKSLKLATIVKILTAALFPTPLDEFKAHFDEGKCLVIEGAANKFDGLVTLGDIERRLNDGCNANHFPQILDHGERHALLNHYSPWSGACLKKTDFTAAIADGLSFMISNSSQVSQGLSRLCDDLEMFLNEENVHADVHLYVSTSAKGGSYNAHRDRPQHKLLIQAIGDANWQLFEPKQEIADDIVAITDDEQDELLNLASEFTLSQGDLLYMPPGVFHRVTSVPGPRVSVSIPFYSMAEASKMDRSYIPFEKLFLEKDSQPQ